MTVSDLLLIEHIVIICTLLVAVVGFQKERYRVSEEGKEIEVCVEMKSQAECPVAFSFELTLSTVEGSAGESVWKPMRAIHLTLHSAHSVMCRLEMHSLEMCRMDGPNG